MVVVPLKKKKIGLWRRAIYRLKGELSKLFSHLTSTRCGPHVWRGRRQIDNPALPTLVSVVERLPGWRIHSITWPKMSLQTWHLRCLGEFQKRKLSPVRLSPFWTQLPLADRIIVCAPDTWREIQIRTLRDFLSTRTQDMDLASVIFVK
jgi:hypothetical protein